MTRTAPSRWLNGRGKPIRTIRKRRSPAVARNRDTSQGFLTPLGLITMLAMIGGLILESSRLHYGLSASIRTAEARRAIDAAEFGMEAILDDLNNNNNSYLLVTKFTNPNGTGTWQNVSAANLSACGLKVPSPAPSANRIAGVSTNSSSSSVALPSDPSVTYSLVSFNPPSGATAPASNCNMFGNLTGGRARMTVRGTVQRNGAIVASFESTRDVFIRPGGAPAPENNLGLVITGAPSASKTGSPFHIVYDQNGDGAIGTSGSSFTEPLGNVNCILCTSPSDLNTGGTSLGSVITGPIPNFPTFPNLTTDPTYAPLLGVAEAPNLGEDYSGNPVPYPDNYPYNHPTSTAPSWGLVDGCEYLGASNAEIGCKLSEIKGFGSIKIRADARPVKLFLSGAFVVSGGNDLKATDGNAATPEALDALNHWKNVWIYGNPGTPDASASNCGQEVTISGSGEAFGARLWFPLGKAKISGGSFGNKEFIGSLWTCIFNQGSGNTGFLIPTDLVATWGLGGGSGYLYRATGGN